jgi:hypothetical protein
MLAPSPDGERILPDNGKLGIGGVGAAAAGGGLEKEERKSLE